MTQFAAPDFDLRLTLESGQVFHWVPDGGGFLGMIGPTPVRVRQIGDCLETNDGAAVRRYFALDHPMGEICASFPGDATMQAAAAFCRGMRIIRQPIWECLATFITSSMKQVAHIAQMSHAIRRRFGTAVEFEERTMFAYPVAATMAGVAEAELRECGLGYRAKNLIGAAAMVADGRVELEELREMSDDVLRAELCRLPGVGTKVANCVMLFAYERLRAFPVDVWIERVLRQHYLARKRKLTPARIAAFAASYFGSYGGYAQQYLFHHARKGSK